MPRTVFAWKNVFGALPVTELPVGSLGKVLLPLHKKSLQCWSISENPIKTLFEVVIVAHCMLDYMDWKFFFVCARVTATRRQRGSCCVTPHTHLISAFRCRMCPFWVITFHLETVWRRHESNMRKERGCFFLFCFFYFLQDACLCSGVRCAAVWAQVAHCPKRHTGFQVTGRREEVWFHFCCFTLGKREHLIFISYFFFISLPQAHLPVEIPLISSAHTVVCGAFKEQRCLNWWTLLFFATCFDNQ